MDELLCEQVDEFLDFELLEIALLLCRFNVALYRILRAHQAQHRHQEP
jgi:hypothetical protein